MYKNATKCNETIGKWCKNKHGASKIIDTFETYHIRRLEAKRMKEETTQKHIIRPSTTLHKVKNSYRVLCQIIKRRIEVLLH
jgi:hypothetical protein